MTRLAVYPGSVDYLRAVKKAGLASEVARLKEREVALPEPHILRYTRWLRDARGLDFDATTNEGYDRLWRWSCDDLTAFWQSVWD